MRLLKEQSRHYIHNAFVVDVHFSPPSADVIKASKVPQLLGEEDPGKKKKKVSEVISGLTIC